MKKILLLIFVLLFFFCKISDGADILSINWDSLVPKLSPLEDPLTGLNEEERGFVEWIIYLRENLPKKVDPKNQKFYDEVNDALPELTEKGIDVDKIIAERQYRRVAVNSDLDGQQVKLAGYLLPLDLSGKAVTDFLLVPYVGACIHAPPPPPNQIVHAVSDTPTPYEIDKLFKPVSVTGQIKVKSVSKELFLTDGSSNIDIGYSMSVNKIEEYKH